MKFEEEAAWLANGKKRRRPILKEVIENAPITPTKLQEKFGTTLQNVYEALSELKDRGLVDYTKGGQSTYYKPTEKGKNVMKRSKDYT